ncbi:MAG TPA: GNAT family N-acetyltransferase [Stellaceae bacterium]|nr:GNAT family N-acetyltransferase [Stellaceae bacterium]
MMPANRPIIARSMRRADAADVVAMARELASVVRDPAPNLDAAALLRACGGPERWSECLVAESDGALLGYALFSRGFEAHTGKRRLWIGDLYLRPPARGIGAGRVLMAAIARRAMELDCSAIFWELWRPNTPARHFYGALGADACDDLAVMCLEGAPLAALAGKSA